MDTEYKICPRCKAEHKASTPKCGCGYSWAEKQAQAYDPYHHHCAYTTSDNRRCHYLGAVSKSTTGSGPWYCCAHSDVLDEGASGAKAGAQIVDQSRRDHPSAGWWSPGRQRDQAEQKATTEATARLEEMGHGRLPFEGDLEYADRLRVVCKDIGLHIKRVPA